MNILAIGTERVISKKVLEELKQKSDFSVIICTPKQVKNIAAINYDVMYVDMLHLGMDEEFEGIIDQIEAGEIKANKIIFLATAGMDKEINPNWIEVQDLKELLLEVKYVAKLVDETELPYTILRPVEVSDEVQNVALNIIPEGEKISVVRVSEANLRTVIIDAITTNNYINQSIGISNKG
ncbi:saccharopine dehydrogenase [Pediococcus pentosaceus]|uniref:NAD(P)H-binding protein n=1 Tax=Pediococcus pentosaceus TaxID=1255 RepID=UPI00223B3189|nr:NAD(P)H-binding protein [Pediococcus pentosaceus]MCT1177249.1 saccharopine dehydrogenase [Pediococcus pentosaceus]